MPVGAATELIELIDDRPGRANEALLDDAREALSAPYERIPAAEQRAAGAGTLVAFEADSEARAAALELIEKQPTTQGGQALDRLRERLRQKLQLSRRRQRSGPVSLSRPGV